MQWKDKKINIQNENENGKTKKKTLNIKFIFSRYYFNNLMLFCIINISYLI